MSVTESCCGTELPERADDPHPIPIGQRVAVLRLPIYGSPFIEGWAVVAGLIGCAHRYLVQFADDPMLRDRVIRPEFQHDPEGVLAALLDLRRAEQAMSASFSTFFPADQP